MGTFEPSARRTRAWATAALLLATASGCAADAERDAESGAQAVLAQQKKDGSVELRPAGVYFAEVSASGTGCPVGSWTSSVSSDGQVFSTIFSSYEVAVNSEVRNATRDCAIVMKLHSDQPREFAVVSVFYSGYAFLEDGVAGRQTVRYGFQGQSADAGNSRTEFTGPQDRDFVIRDDVGADKQKWSACGAEHELTASTELRLQGKGTQASGYINTLAVDGSATKLELKLGWRTCAAKPGNGNTTGNGTTTGNGSAKGNAKT